MKRAMAALLLLLLAGTLAVFAQQQTPPKPGAEHKRLAYFAGNWSGEADMKESPFGPAGKVTMTERCEVFPGGYFIVAHSEGKGPMGEMKGLSIIGYDAKKKAYTYTAINNMMGDAETAEGTYNNGTWTWTNEVEMQGKRIKSRFIIKEDSPSTYSFKWETASGGAPMAIAMEGKMTKTAGKPGAKKSTQQ